MIKHLNVENLKAQLRASNPDAPSVDILMDRMLESLARQVLKDLTIEEEFPLMERYNGFWIGVQASLSGTGNDAKIMLQGLIFSDYAYGWLKDHHDEPGYVCYGSDLVQCKNIAQAVYVYCNDTDADSVWIDPKHPISYPVSIMAYRQAEAKPPKITLRGGVVVSPSSKAVQYQAILDELRESFDMEPILKPMDSLAQFMAVYYPDMSMDVARRRIADNVVNFTIWSKEATSTKKENGRILMKFPNGLSVLFDTAPTEAGHISDGGRIFCEALENDNISRFDTSDEFFLWLTRYF